MDTGATVVINETQFQSILTEVGVVEKYLDAIGVSMMAFLGVAVFAFLACVFWRRVFGGDSK